LRQKFKGISAVSWIDGNGRTLKEETPGGFALGKKLRQKRRASLIPAPFPWI
jgi:hypothetical protein